MQSRLSISAVAVKELALFLLLLAIPGLGESRASAATLEVTNITATYNCDIFGCNVSFNNTVCNRDAANYQGGVLGSRWDSSGTIFSSCTGYWDSQDTYTLPPATCSVVVTYGPGFVGGKISAGACLTVTSNPDIYCHVTTTPLTKLVCKS